MRRGLILSDLHLFARRSDTLNVQTILDKITSDTDFILLNGDIIDFRWSHHDGQDASITAGLEWLRALHIRAPHAKIYYVMGNHDCAHPWGRALDILKSDRFEWSSSHFRLGDSLFLHGDLPMEGKHPFSRKLIDKTHSMPMKPLMNVAYETFLQLRGHKAVGNLFTPKLCANLIGNALKKHPHPDSANIKHIYFGHTHNPFTDFLHNGITYHNTGSTIRLLTPNPLMVTVDD